MRDENTARSNPSSPIAGPEDLERALATGAVNLVHLIDACYWLRHSPPEATAGLPELVAGLEEAFRKSSGFEEIKGTSFYHAFRSGVLVTDSGQIYTYYDSQNPFITPEGEKLLWDMEGFSHESESLLGSRSRELLTLGRKLYELTLHLLYAVDEATKNDETDGLRVERAVGFVREEFQKARQFRDRVALRIAQGEYVRGMATGVLLFGVAVALLGSLLWVTYRAGAVPASVVRHALGALTAGALGAVLSVLQRLTSGKLVLDVFAGAQLLRRLGGFRPVVGGFFGVVTFAAVEGGIVPLDPPEGSEAVFFFYCAIAFLAGFNERWAQDMLGKGAQNLAGAGESGDRPGSGLW